MDPSGRPPAEGGAAWRRRQRRLRSWWRHEQQSVAAALATFSHHSAQRPKTARAREGRELKNTAAFRMPLPGGWCPVFCDGRRRGRGRWHQPPGGQHRSLRCCRRRGWGGTAALGYELVLANAVPQLGVELDAEQHLVMAPVPRRKGPGGVGGERGVGGEGEGHDQEGEGSRKFLKFKAKILLARLLLRSEIRSELLDRNHKLFLSSEFRSKIVGRCPGLFLRGEFRSEFRNRSSMFQGKVLLRREIRMRIQEQAAEVPGLQSIP